MLENRACALFTIYPLEFGVCRNILTCSSRISTGVININNVSVLFKFTLDSVRVTHNLYFLFK